MVTIIVTLVTWNIIKSLFYGIIGGFIFNVLNTDYKSLMNESKNTKIKYIIYLMTTPIKYTFSYFFNLSYYSRPTTLYSKKWVYEPPFVLRKRKK